MKIVCADKQVEKLIHTNRRPDGQLAEGVYVAMACNADTGELHNLWIGTPETGPMLAYHPDSGWSPIYSRGNYGKNYACGGNWSSHCRNLLKSRLIGIPPKGDKSCELLAVGDLMPLPPGLEGDITMTEIDCTGSHAVWFESASDAIEDMLCAEEILRASLPRKTIAHLSACDYDAAQDRVLEVVRAFGL